MPNTDKAIHLMSGKSRMLSGVVVDNLMSIEELVKQFRTSVEDHLASENIQSDEEEKGILLDLSNEIAAARNKEELFILLRIKLKSLFDVSGFAIALNGDGIGAFNTFVSSPLSDQNNGCNVEGTFIAPNELPVALFEKMGSSGFPQIFDLTETIKQYPIITFFKLWSAFGVENFSGIELKANGDVLGYLFFYLDRQLFESLRIKLLRAVCAQLSVAFSNIMLIEEIVQRKNESELLLSVNTAIASVRFTDELANVIKQELKQLLGCSHTLIAVRSENTETVSAFMLDEDARSINHPGYQNAKNGKYSLNDPILGQALITDLPLVIDLEAMATSQDLPIYAKINYESGQKLLVMTRFTKGEEVFGFWLLYFEDKEIIPSQKLKLIQSLSNQLCIAVANIIANQEIKNREEEKGRLLEFSNAIASVRDSVVLSQILKAQLQELFGIDNYIIHALDPEKIKHKPVLFDPEGLFISNQAFLTFLDTWTFIDEGFLDKVLGEDGPILFKMHERTDSLLIPAYLIPEKEETNKAFIGISIKLGSENIAVMSFKHQDFTKIKAQEILLKSICSQIAIAVANILANDRVSEQLIEIERYKRQLEEETIYLKEEMEITQNYAEIVGESLAVQKTYRLITQVAPTDSTVLILGETGTGKELIARAIHNNSPRKNKLMVKVNCAALPANLIESELFGHERGSFTGATERRIGKFELAHNGTLFLDEIGEMPLELQVKLLRALQEKEIERVGGRNTIKVDVRIIAATNRDLEKEIDQGRFRTDLFYRLNIFPIYSSALRERKEDIPILATHFIHRYSKKVGRQITTLGNKALKEMMLYNWPGNIRELEHLIERSILLTTGDALKQIHLPNNKQNLTTTTGDGQFPLKTIDENECDHILKILKHCQGRISGRFGAAEILGIPASTLNSKIKRLGIKKEHLV
ncbi:formate hydrogenlyase transcriptional activator [Mucilaginibacter sp. UYP25]|uniref:sigma-54-dependent Fis family transcriptional regulator n=1 Tax=unclassified Mucilaginibacter TaxID=2617802 RepID=UPI0033920D70